MHTFNDAPQYLAWIEENIGRAGWEFKTWSHTNPNTGRTGYFERWCLVTRDVDGNVIPHKEVSDEFMGAGEALFARCDVAIQLMGRDFPELTEVRGYYRNSYHEESWTYHCWLIDSQGRIVDPTGRQFDRRELEQSEQEIVWDVKDGSYRAGQYLGMVFDGETVSGLEGLAPEHLSLVLDNWNRVL